MDKRIQAMLKLNHFIWYQSQIGVEVETLDEVIDLMSTSILDDLGFPQDTTVKLEKDYDNPEYFCRDYLYDILWDRTNYIGKLEEAVSILDKLDEEFKELNGQTKNN